MEPPLIECEDVSRSVSGRAQPLLDRVTISIEQGELLALVGPSGSGKSSLLRILNRLDEPDSGSVALFGKPYTSWPVRELRRRIGLSMQGGVIFPGSVRDNLCVASKIHQNSCHPEELAAMVGLSPDLLGQSGNSLSGGERQRVVLARMLANDPDILLLDEPTSALDPGSRQELGHLIGNLHRQRRARGAVIWVTHFMEEAERYADRVAVFDAGQVIATGPWVEVAGLVERRLKGGSMIREG